MASPTLTTVSWVFVVLVTLITLLSLGRGVAHMWRQIRSGTPAPGRTRPFGRRLWGVLETALSHREFRHRPVVRAAHWLVMMSFPLLFLTLISGYAHLRDQLWSLPLIGHWPVWEWIVDLFAWAGLAGIVTFMVVRARAGRPSLAEASLSSDELLSDDGSPAPEDQQSQSAWERSQNVGARSGLPDQPASRFLGSTRWQALFVEWVIVLVCASVIVLRALDAALLSLSPGHEAMAAWWHFPLSFWGSSLFVSALHMSASALANTIVCVSAFKIIVSMIWMMVVGVQTGMGVAWHRFIAPLNIFFRRHADGTKSLGEAAPLVIDGGSVTSPDAFDDLSEDTVLGVGTISDFSWKARLDFYACTECGRCQELCPAWNTQKPLSPKLLVMSLRDHMESTSNLEIVEREVTDAEIPGEDTTLADLASLGAAGAETMLLEKGANPSPHSMDLVEVLSASGATGAWGVADTEVPLVPSVISPEVLWDCTMCGACVEQCPVDIEHIDHILDLRRHQVLMEAAFPRELGKAFRAMESKGNPYNQPARKRMEWAKNLDFDVPVIGEDIEDASEVDYLFWVGCAGAYDDRAKQTSAAVAELLHTAGVSFAVLGSGESCTGDPARRAGNEVLFQMLAANAIETLTEAKARTIVVSCAHCFNTIVGEYPQLGGTFDVVHHTQLLNRLVREGLLTPVAPREKEGERPLTVTYHDACFLGRHNRVYEPPRELVSSLPNVELVEMPRNHDRAMCCGAGGAHAWFDDKRGISIADARMVEAAQTGADVVATACPFCSQMLGSASGSSAGFVSSAPASASAAADTPREGEASTTVGSDQTPAESRHLPEVKDVALMLLEAVRRGQEQS